VSYDFAKRAAAEAALPYLAGHALIGVGSGTTVDAFLDVLVTRDLQLHAVVPASRHSAERLRAAGIAVLEPNEVDELPVYVDGADEVDPDFHLVKGAGGASTREKIVASMSELFVCLVDDSKPVSVLGCSPIPVEVLHFAERHAIKRLRDLGGHPVMREGFLTDDGNHILDVDGLPVAENPLALERALDAIPGVVGHGLFATRPADVVLIASNDGSVETRRR